MPCQRARSISLPSGSCIGQCSECTERIVKYMANRPAKNMSSLDSQMIVPTLTRFGRVSECTRLDSKRGGLAVDVTIALCRDGLVVVRRGAPRVATGRWLAETSPIRCAHDCDARRPPPLRSSLRCGTRCDAHSGGQLMTTASADRVTVVVYSNLGAVRAQVRTAVGRRPAPDVPRIDWIECDTSAQVVAQIDLGEIDLVIVDGEAQPTGGMGLARQFKYEIDDCPPIVVLVARKDDGWLASWSLADGVISRPLDPVTAAEVVADQLRKRVSGIPVVR